MQRHDGRASGELRTIVIHEKAFGYAPGAVLLEVGNTKVLCSVTLQQGVPPFLRGKGTGWLVAEYGMLPTATQERTTRSSSSATYNGRSVEISRLIGRALRAMVNLKALADYTIFVDCDVLQADGGTRTTSITGAYLALMRAQEAWLASRLLKHPFLTDQVAAVSVGVLNNECILDPSYQEDSAGQADFNFVIARSGGIVEVQGGAELAPVKWDLFMQAQELARNGAEQWFALFDQEYEKIRTARLGGQSVTQDGSHAKMQQAVQMRSHGHAQSSAQPTTQGALQGRTQARETSQMSVQQPSLQNVEPLLEKLSSQSIAQSITLKKDSSDSKKIISNKNNKDTSKKADNRAPLFSLHNRLRISSS